MTENTIQLQHTSKSAAGFTHEGISVTSDEDGIISIPSHVSAYAQAHGFHVPAEKPVPKALKGGGKLPLAKAAESEESEQDEKPAKEDAPKALKGGK